MSLSFRQRNTLPQKFILACNLNFFFNFSPCVLCNLTVPGTSKAPCFSRLYANFHLQVGLFIGWNHSQIPLRNYLIENQGGEKKKEQQVWWFYTALLSWLLGKDFVPHFFFLRWVGSHPKNVNYYCNYRKINSVGDIFG